MKLSGSLLMIAVLFSAALKSHGLSFFAIRAGIGEDGIYRVTVNDPGSPESIGTVVGSSELSSLTTRPGTPLYALERASSSLLAISKVDASVISSVILDIPLQTRPRGLELSPDGTLFGVFSGGATGIQLRTIDPVTGGTALACALSGTPQIEAIAFANDGRLFGVGAATAGGGSTLLYLIDYTNAATLGQVTPVRDMTVPPLSGTFPDIDAMTMASDGVLYAANSRDSYDGDLYKIDPATGDLTNLGGMGVSGLNGLAGISDLDHDGLADEVETGTGVYVSNANTGTSPTTPDSDGDGLPDGVEVFTHDTNPNLADTDEDGYTDGFEVRTGFDATSDSSVPDAHSSILIAVEFRFSAALGEAYRVEGSDDLANWTIIEDDIAGNGSEIVRFYSTTGQRFKALRAREN